MRLTRFLGRGVGGLLRSEPFSSWAVVRTRAEHGVGREIRFVFGDGHSEVVCDESERVEAILVHASAGLAMHGFTFSATRAEMRGLFGVPQASGAVRASVNGNAHGAWDRFDLHGDALHVEYRLDHNGLERITLIGAGSR